MSGPRLQEVPTEELLSFQDYPAVHNTNPTAVSPPYLPTQVDVALPKSSTTFNDYSTPDSNPNDEDTNTGPNKSFWTLEYYQQFFDVDTQDVLQRIAASMIPTRSYVQHKPDLYGPFWISVTLIFVIAISGNIADYLQHANEQYHWKYDFHLVSYAATAICIYVFFVPLTLWSLLKWTYEANLDETQEGKTPSILELICLYGYSLFIYIPVSILWSIQVGWLQWLLVLVAASLSGSVLLLSLMPSFKLSRHTFLLNLGTIFCHLLLAAGFKMYFFHTPDSTITSITHSNSTTNIKPL